MSKDDKNPIDEMFATADAGRAAAATIAGVRNELVEHGIGGDIADRMVLEMFRTNRATIEKEAAEVRLKIAELNIGRPF